MRYLVALAIAGVLIWAVSLYANWAKNSFNQRLRQASSNARQPDGSLPEADPNDENSLGANMEVTETEMLHINLIDLWINFRMIFIPLLLIGSLAVARSIECPVSKPVTETASKAQG